MSDANREDTAIEFKARVRDYILEHFPLARQQQPGDDDSLLDSGIIDSLGILEIVNFFGESFSLEVADEDLTPENFESISSLAAFAARKRNDDRGGA